MSGGGHSEVAKRRLRIQHVIDERTCVDARARYHQFSFVVPITQHLPLLCLKAIPVTLRRGETQVRIKYRFNFSSPSSQFLYKNRRRQPESTIERTRLRSQFWSVLHPVLRGCGE